MYKAEKTHKKATFWKLDGKIQMQKLSVPTLWNIPQDIFLVFSFWVAYKDFLGTNFHVEACDKWNGRDHTIKIQKRY